MPRPHRRPARTSRALRPSVTAVVLALSSSTVIGVSVPAVRTGASFTALTVIERLSVRLLAFGGVLLPLSVTVQVTLPVPLASATVLYFSPCNSAAVTVPLTITCVVPSALKICTYDGNRPIV